MAETINGERWICVYAVAFKCTSREKRLAINYMPGVREALLESAGNGRIGRQARRKGIMYIMRIDERSPGGMKKPINRYGLKAYLTKAYDLKPGKRIKYSEPGENGGTYLYEVVKLYPHCILLKDTFGGARICPGYEKLMLMMRGAE